MTGIEPCLEYWRAGKTPEDAVQWGAAHGICVQETPGDVSMVKQSDVEKEVKRALSGGGVSALR